MGYKVSVFLPNLPDGEMVEVDGVGFFPNGGTYPVPDDFNEAVFIAHHPNRVGPQVDEDEEGNPVYEAFSFLNAFDATYGVSVEFKKDKEEKQPEFEVPQLTSTNPPADKAKAKEDGGDK